LPILFLGSDLDGVGGIQRYSRWMIEALGELGPCEVIDLALPPTGGSLTGKASGAIAALSRWSRLRPRLVVLGHLSFAPLAAPQLLGRRPAVALAYGIEVWGPPSAGTRAALRRLSRVWPISTFTTAEVRRVEPRARIGPVLGAGLDDSFFTAPRSRPSGPAIRVLMVARLDDLAYKGIDTSIDAVRRVSASIEVELRIVGDGPGRAALDELIRARDAGALVRRLGSVDDHTLREEYARADVVVCVSRFRRGYEPRGEGLGIVPLEAAAAGVPAIVGNVGGTVDTVVDGVTGLLVPPGDVDSLAAALLTLGRDPERRIRMGRAAQAFVRQVHSREAFQRRVRDAVGEVVG
jgi:phosphatidylinositol alpha-1,6-mannosyltransferase